MAKNPCPHCGQPIAIDDLNIAEGVGLCRACGTLSKLSDVVEPVSIDPAAVMNPPSGCSYTPPLAGHGSIIYTSLRSPGTAIGLFAISLFWNGIVSIFVLIALAATYKRLVGPVPSWFPAPKDNGDMTGSLGGLLFLWVFLSPFIAIGISLLIAVFISIAGRIEVTIHETMGRVRTGVGPLNWTRRFDPTTVKRVSVDKTARDSEGRQKPNIRIETEDRSFTFASTLPDYRRDWLTGVLHLLLVAPGKEQRQRLGVTAAVRH